MSKFAGMVKVKFTPEFDGPVVDGAEVVRANGFYHHEYGPNEWIVMVPGEGYGWIDEVSADLNDNARSGRYDVSELTEEEIDFMQGKFPHA